ncbi:MAG: tRNA 2-thiouridine(34) synthase MnmA [Candidatus Peribacteraceae bacterium]|nr:tRNA 2-thiouridine(34) synthase MnmA [Candidatus Peribacteraceae bacterium]
MKILCAISGGVDSAVAAALLQKRGHKLIAVHLDLFGKRNSSVGEARAVAAKLKIPFYVLNFRADFEKRVIKNFLKSYAQNRTPNPCIICNPQIKFGKLLTKMRELGCDRLATGHYARIRRGGLFRGVDSEKDQSYFLCRLTEEKLKSVVFPLGNLKKSDVKKKAQALGFGRLAQKKESSGICFLEKTEVGDFLKKHLPRKVFRPGKIRTLNGQIVGKHQGLPLYTIGQRRGVELGGMPEPFFVAGFDLKKNEVLVAPNRELFTQKLKAKKLSWISQPPKNGAKILAQIRYRAPAVPGKIHLSGTQATFEFTEPVRAVTPGQTVAFFQNQKCLGGGEIC